MKYSINALLIYLVMIFSSQSYANEQTITDAFSNGKVSGDFRLRYEHVDQDNALDDASALTLRSRLAYKTGEFKGFSAQIEMEDSREVGGDDNYNDANGQNTGVYSVIADPETTEVDQFNLQYKNKHVNIIAGRQVFTLDGQRHIGHVGWRQDRQTFDGVVIKGKLGKNINATYAKLESRNRIFAESKDINSNDNLFNVSYQTPYGKAAAYVYLLEEDNGAKNELDTKGLSFKGGTSVADARILYALEYAKQEDKTSSNTMDYKLFEVGAKIKGITTKVGYEVLGSDDSQGFATPLATLHKFNGWSDQFLATPAQGLVDKYISVAGKLANGKLLVAYHDFSADEPTPSVDDLGEEINLLYVKKFGKHYSAGVKYAKYSAEDIKVDTEKSWVWVGASF